MSHPNQLPREFRMASGGFGRMAAPFVLVLVFFFAVMLLLGSVVGGVIGGVIAGVVGTGALTGVLYAKFRRMRSGTLVRFSEYGVELSDTLGFHVRLGWRDITRMGRVDTRMASAEKVGADGGVQVGVGAMQSLGLIGWGEWVVPPNAPGWMRENLAAQPLNPADGRPQVAIPLGGIDPNWTHGPMGQWVRLYRPDLLAPAQPAHLHPGHHAQAGQAVFPGHPAQAGQTAYPSHPAQAAFPGRNAQPGHPAPAAQPGHPRQPGSAAQPLWHGHPNQPH